MKNKNHATSTENCTTQALPTKTSDVMVCKEPRTDDHKYVATNTVHLPVLDSHMRLNFLHQSAVHISMQSEFGHCPFTIHIINSFQLSYLQVRRCELRMVQKKVLQRKCLFCYHSQNYHNDTKDLYERTSCIKRRGGVAPIKTSFLIAKQELITVAAQEDNVDILKDISALKIRNRENRKLRKGMNKNRMREMKQAETQIRALAYRLCPSVIQHVKCRFGDKCTSEHDIKVFLSKKPADIAMRADSEKHIWMQMGNNYLKHKPEIPYKETLNASSMHIQIALRKRTYIFKNPDQVCFKVKCMLGSVEVDKRKLDMKTLSGKKYLAPLTTVVSIFIFTLYIYFSRNLYIYIYE
uniref:Zf-CCCH_4 domain-containing protein n=1 Tax=Heterorhabditis bacteriophora TaxID=37862 RepID=A0A1I7WSW2_HETBA